MRLVFNLLLLLAVSLPVTAQEQAAEVIAEAPKSSGSFLINTVIVVFIVAALILLVVAFVLLRTFNILAKELSNPRPFVASEPVVSLDYEDWLAAERKKPSIINKLLSLRPIEEEKDLIMEHKFDGIAELDNPTPPWFMWLFYGTIAFGVAYFLNYHVFEWGMLQDEEYVVEVQEAEAAKAEYLATAANLIDEKSVTVNTEPAVISAGMALYNTNCVACHGDKGQGTVGPNLTDEYWLHGGSVNDVFKTIKYGIPEKGMISWEKQMTPKQISEVSNYILSLKGTNPAGAKEPQGEKEG
ncbi:cytochrome c oxidase cbb3-type subunit 3 [Arcticibacter pallidicorallinus]|uniref:Cytochrome c oxidase cbb3-type subunit 3 n=1 Tax=Arcticibacter pallidicorallinus TaxID=1259464 RepID=A0A2T0U959_9SPHI|nr:cbb3-type cytochrome c oxidase N-terminal domain-containing protein [Arcticibacter pallidicorallinus]PRY54367.1 cytochrome c oxidase cbb3-type subunit 3 [Arcticibacter pallidicorallinus]